MSDLPPGADDGRRRRPDPPRRAGLARLARLARRPRHGRAVAPAGRDAPHGRGAAPHRPPPPRQPGARRRAGRGGRRARAAGRPPRRLPRTPRSTRASASRRSPGATPHAFFDHSPMLGRANPLAPPIQLWVEGDVLRGRATFGSAYEGPPGCVHGGYVAAAFDEVLGSTQSLAGRPGMTARLTVNYRSPTPLHTELQLRRPGGRRRGPQDVHRGHAARRRSPVRRERGPVRRHRLPQAGRAAPPARRGVRARRRQLSRRDRTGPAQRPSSASAWRSLASPPDRAAAGAVARQAELGPQLDHRHRGRAAQAEAGQDGVALVVGQRRRGPRGGARAGRPGRRRRPTAGRSGSGPSMPAV